MLGGRNFNGAKNNRLFSRHRYEALYATGRIREIGGWAHARRGFVEALSTDARAALMVALIQQFYQIEHAAADLDPDARRKKTPLRMRQRGGPCKMRTGR